MTADDGKRQIAKGIRLHGEQLVAACLKVVDDGVAAIEAGGVDLSVGQDLVKGLAGSIDDNGDKAVKAAENMSSDISDVMNTLSDDMKTSLPTDFSVDGNIKSSLDSVNSSIGGQGGLSLILNITNFNNYSSEDINQLTNEIMETAGQFAKRKGMVFA